MRRWHSGLAAAALLLGACVPRTVPPTAPPPPPAAPPAIFVPADPPTALDEIDSAPPVRVGLLVDTTRVEVSSATGLEVVGADERVLGRAAAGEQVTVTPGSGGTLRAAGSTGAVIATGPAPLLFRPAGGGVLTIGGRPYRGEAVVQLTPAGRVTAVNVLDMETYLLGVVPREIGKVGPELLEAAKAQAVAARTYAVKYLGRRRELGFDVFATVQDQVYGGAADEHDPVSRAVRETEGEILSYDGRPIEAYYHSTCAGRTAAIEEVWNERPVPYLVSVVDVDPATGESYDRSSSRFRWTQRWTAEQINGILARTLRDSLPPGAASVGQLRDMRVLERTPSGRVRAMRIETTGGTFTVGKDRIRWILLTPAGAALNSSKFDVEVVRGAGGRVTEVVATGGGWGHGIGMCQVGAMGRARAGQDYRTILQAYYPGTRHRDLY
ncbi:MAG TPA: SpoIID/LytB domain-containing protein [Longimicrobiaceae bacterium]|nr:SpoIID/LytB domain-containing protein [Longimicrobiaceae bacterium]